MLQNICQDQTRETEFQTFPELKSWKKFQKKNLCDIEIFFSLFYMQILNKMNHRSHLFL